jgi:hypothetical protein
VGGVPEFLGVLYCFPHRGQAARASVGVRGVGVAGWSASAVGLMLSRGSACCWVLRRHLGVWFSGLLWVVLPNAGVGVRGGGVGPGCGCVLSVA